LHIGIRTQFFILFTLVSGVPIVWFGLNEAERQASFAIAENREHGLALVASVSREVQSQLEHRVEVVERLASHAASLEVWDDENLARVVEAHGRDVDGFSFLYVADDLGVSKAASPALNSEGEVTWGTDYSGRDYFMAARATRETSVSRVQLGKRTGVPNLQIGAPILFADGSFRGIAEGSIDLGGLQVLVKAVASDLMDYRVVVIDNHNAVVADSGRAKIDAVQSIADVPLLAASLGHNDVRVMPDADGISQWAVVQSLFIRGQSWRVVAVRPLLDLLHSAEEARWKTRQAAIGALAVGLFGAFLGALALSAPLRGLSRTARSIREGTDKAEFSPVKSWHAQEILELSVAMKQMVKRLKAHTKNLTATSEQRARDLAVANTRLEIMAIAVDYAAEAWQIIGPDERVEYVNHAFVEMTGYTVEDLRTTPEVLVEYQAGGATLRDILGDETNVGGLTRNGIRKDGSRYIEELSVGVIGDEATGQVWRYFCVRRDVTRRHEKEMNLRNLQVSVLQEANDKLASSFQHQADALSNMSHELRTPLHSILGVAEVLEEGVYGPLSDKQTKAVGAINTAGEHLLGLINQVLDLRKMEQGYTLASRVRTPANQLAEDSFKLAIQADRADVLRVDLVLSDEPLFILGDPMRMRQVLINLLGNAQKFTPDGGRVTLEVRRAQDGGFVHFTVTDTGEGIAEDELEKIFLPFHQIDSGVSRKFSGSGLGLALVQRFVHEHGGTVNVQSQEGKGTTFVVSIPEDSEATETDRLVVAIVENDDEATSAFEGFRVEVKRFSTGRQMLSFLEKSPVDLIVVDFLVNDMPFDSFMDKLAGLNESMDLPVVMITRMTDSLISHDVRIYGYLSRPIQIVQVEALIARLTEDRCRNLEGQT
jgi:PAS domain S-box-containing protein